MKEPLISFETAMLAKEAGINLGAYLNVNVDNPPNMNSNYNPRESQPWFINITQSLLQKILREKYNIHIITRPVRKPTVIKDFYVSEIFGSSIQRTGDTYEEALEGGLQEVLRIIINKINNNEKG